MDYSNYLKATTPPALTITTRLDARRKQVFPTSELEPDRPNARAAAVVKCGYQHHSSKTTMQ